VLLGNLFASVTANRIGSRWLVYIGFGLLSFGILLAALAQTLPLLFAAQFCIGFAQGASYPVLMGLSIKYVADSERATAMGLHQSVYALGMFAGPWLSGILASNIGIQSTFVITALICLVLGLYGASKLERGVPDIQTT
jgi:MFS family permease